MGLGRSKIKISDIDADGNGVITREEVHQYVGAEVEKCQRIYDERLNEWKRLYEEKMFVKDEIIEKLQNGLDIRVKEKEKELEEWKTSYDELHQKYSDLMDDMRKKSYKKQGFISKSSGISPEAIEDAVKEILADPNLNLKKVPDFVEKRLYHNIIWITLTVLERMFVGVSVDAFGHEFHLTMNPKPDSAKLKVITSEGVEQ